MTIHKGRGFTCINYPIGINLDGDPSQALVHATPDGKFKVTLSAIDLGQGMKSVTHQIAAEALGVPVADVYVDTADSDTGEMTPVTCFAHAALIVDLQVDDETGDVTVTEINSRLRSWPCIKRKAG